MSQIKQYTWIRAQQEVIKALKTAIGKTYSPTIDELTLPPDATMGDIAYPCFVLAKGLKRSPVEIATELAAKIGPKGMITKIISSGPYINFVLDLDDFASAVIKEVQVAGDAYGKQNIGKGRRIMIEYANPNTHKEVHVGHLRNLIVGHLTINLLRAIGHDVIAASYINDLGNNVAKCLWAVKALHDGEKPEPGEEINFLGKLYVEATEAAKKDEHVLREISEIQRQLEDQRGEWHKVWKETRKWSIDALYEIFNEIGIPIDKQYYESELIDETKNIVRELQDQGIAKLDDGAIIVDLEDEDLGANLLVKSDGALLYNAKDLALAVRKEEDYSLERSLIVVDERQSLAMRQLFATLKRMGVQIPYEHLSYNFVTLPDGAMSSRKGNVVLYEELRDSLRSSASAETKHRHSDWSQKQIDMTANYIAHSAMVYAMAKQDPKKDLVFDLDEALSFEGMTGPYLLYSTSRIASVLKKASIKPDVSRASVGSAARPLLQLIARFPSIVADSAQRLSLSDVPHYAFDLAQEFSHYYAAERIIDPEDENGTAARLALCDAVLITLKNALHIVNIKPLEEM